MNRSPLPVSAPLSPHRGERAGERGPRPGASPRHTLRPSFLLFTLLLLSFPVIALDWQAGPGFRSAALPARTGASNGFVRLAPAVTSVHFTNSLPVDRFTTNQIYLNGSGVCAGDIDGDGWTDLFFAGLAGQSTLYRNRGNWRFENVTHTAGLTSLCRDLDATGAVFADTDGDGDLDLVVNSTGGGTHGFANDGQGRFQRNQLLNPGRGGTSLALADIDGDGDLDLYVANYRTETLRDQPRTNFRIGKTNDQFVVTLVNNRPTTLPALQGRFTYLASGSIIENGEPDALFLNQGPAGFVAASFTDGTFLDESGQPLAQPLYDWGLSVLLRDINGDGQPDLYVCNDFASPDRFWINQGAGRFRAAPTLALRNTSKFSMGVDAADINRDGHDDLFVLDMMSRDHSVRLTRMDASMDSRPLGATDSRPQLSRTTLQLSRGDGTFAEIAQYAGLEASEWAWVPLFLDIDLDGFEDLLIATGHARDDMHIDYGMRIEAIRKSSRMSTLDELGLRKSTPPISSPGLAFRNLGNLRFEGIPGGWGWGDRKTVSQGTCLADLDNDGDLDVAVNCLNDVAGLYCNLSTAPRIAVRLKGLPPNTRGIGARLSLEGGGAVPQSQEMICGGRYLSGDDPLRVFAANPAPASDGSRPAEKPSLHADSPRRLEVRWRSGHRSVITDVRPDRVYEIDEAQATPPSPPATPTPDAPLFADESARLGYRHYESAFDDFERQPLLPRRCSQAGPGVAWLDLDGDGRDDLFLASGKGGRPGVFLNAGNGQFRLVEPDPASHDQTAVVGWPSRAPANAALVATSAYENPEAGGAALMSYDASGARTEILPLGRENPGPLALADIDADGDLDLFVGGGPVGGRYPNATPSHFFHREGNAWVSSATLDRVVADAGLVSGAVWSDLDGDGFPELILACEWGPIRVYQNQRGTLREATSERGLLDLTGWWTGIQSGDFDGDGQLDLVAGNWGLNSRYRPTREHPVRLYFGDLAGQGQVELIESSFEPSLAGWVPERDLMTMSKQLPWLRGTFASHAAYARARVEDLLAGREVSPRKLEASTLASTVFLNRGDRFEAVPLPPEAQLAPVFGVNVADFNLDGKLDLFLAQNFFAVSPAVSGQDAGRGLLLLGDGRGHFQPASGTRSGIRIYGEQRGSAVADYDADGRPDLVVSQNAAETRLYRNTTPSPGLQIRIRGPQGNPAGIGTTLRVVDPVAANPPVHEIHAGGGYRSHDAPSAFLPRPRGPLTLEVRQPGGRTTRHTLPVKTEANLITLDPSSAQPNP